MPFLDTNVILRHLLADDPDQSPRATAYLQRIELSEIQVHISDTVVFETVFTLERTYKFARSRIRDVVVPLLELPGIVLPGKLRLRKTFDLYVDHNLPFADAYHAVTAGALKLDDIVSFDRDFDRIPGITRIEP